MNITLSTLGVLCIALAILGGNVQIGQVTVKQLSRIRVVFLVLLGISALALGYLDDTAADRAAAAKHSGVTTSVVQPVRALDTTKTVAS
jgi:hypothetical protein